MEKYYVITSSDGRVSIDALSKEQLEEGINDEDWLGKGAKFLDKIPNLEYMGNNEILIIKGEIVLPAVAEVVKKYKL